MDEGEEGEIYVIKYAFLLLFFMVPVSANETLIPTYVGLYIESIMYHEDGHYDKAAEFGLRPSISYSGRDVTYDQNTTDNRLLDIIGAGITYEQHLKSRLHHLHLPSDPYSVYSLHQFANGLSSDGQDYYELMPEAKSELKRMAVTELLLLPVQVYLWKTESRWFIKSKVTIDRRGPHATYELSYWHRF